MHICTKWKVNSCPCFNTYKWPQQSSHGVSSSWLYGGSLLLMKSLFMWVERTSCSPVSILSASDVSSVASRLMLSKPSLLPYTHKNTANKPEQSQWWMLVSEACSACRCWVILDVCVCALTKYCMQLYYYTFLIHPRQWCLSANPLPSAVTHTCSQTVHALNACTLACFTFLFFTATLCRTSVGKLIAILKEDSWFLRSDRRLSVEEEPLYRPWLLILLRCPMFKMILKSCTHSS